MENFFLRKRGELVAKPPVGPKSPKRPRTGIGAPDLVGWARSGCQATLTSVSIWSPGQILPPRQANVNQHLAASNYCQILLSNPIARCRRPPLVGNLLSHGAYPPSRQAGRYPSDFLGPGPVPRSGRQAKCGRRFLRQAIAAASAAKPGSERLDA